MPTLDDLREEETKERCHEVMRALLTATSWNETISLTITRAVNGEPPKYVKMAAVCVIDKHGRIVKAASRKKRKS